MVGNVIVTYKELGVVTLCRSSVLYFDLHEKQRNTKHYTNKWKAYKKAPVLVIKHV